MSAAWAERSLPPLCAAAAWATYLPLGSKYASLAALVVISAVAITRAGRWRRVGREPITRPMLALLGLLALSGLWSSATAERAASQWAQYALMTCVPVIGIACSAASARRALAHFVAASSLVALLFVADSVAALPPSPLWHTTLQAEGNQRIATSMLLALACALALWLGSRERLQWWLAAGACASGLVLQDRRSGMVLLPLLVLVGAWQHLRSPAARLRALAAVVLLAAAALSLSGGLRQRFAEGWHELQRYEASDQVTSSWGQRLRMWQHTTGFVAERPWLGHGLASWKDLWAKRVSPGTMLALNTTPHNEYLMLAAQAGLIGLALWLAVLWNAWIHALRAGPGGVPALLAWTAIASMSLANAALKDAKFALPLVLLAGLGLAVARSDAPAGRS